MKENMLKDLVGKDVVVSISFGELTAGSPRGLGQFADAFLDDRSTLAFVLKGKLQEFDDKFIKLDDGTVISLMYVRFIKLA